MPLLHLPARTHTQNACDRSMPGRISIFENLTEPYMIECGALINTPLSAG